MPKGNIPRSKSGKILDYLINRSNVGKPFRAAVDLMRDPPSLTGPIRSKDIERSFSAASLATAGSIAAGVRPKNSVGTGGRPFKVSGANSKVQVTPPKPGSSKFIGPVKPKAKNKSKAQAVSSSATSSSRYKVTGAQPNYTGPKPKPGSKTFIGPTRPAQPGEKGFIGPINRPVAGQANFIGPVRPAPKNKNKNLPKYAAIVAGETAVLGGGAYATYKLTMPENKKNIVGNNPNRGLAYYGAGTLSSGSSEKPTGGGPKSRQGSSSPSMGVKRSDSYFGDVPSYKGTQKAKTFKKKNLAANQKAGKDAKKTAKASAAAPRKAREMTFQEAVRRNVTEEYMKKKMRPKKSLLGSLRKKGNN